MHHIPAGFSPPVGHPFCLSASPRTIRSTCIIYRKECLCAICAEVRARFRIKRGEGVCSVGTGACMPVQFQHFACKFKLRTAAETEGERGEAGEG